MHGEWVDEWQMNDTGMDHGGMGGWWGEIIVGGREEWQMDGETDGRWVENRWIDEDSRYID